MFEFSITITFQDYMRLYDYHLSHTKNGRATLRSIRLITPLMCVLALILMWISGTDENTLLHLIIGFCVISLFMAIIAKSYVLRIYRGKLKKLSKEGKLPYSSHEHLIFEDDHFTAIADEQKTEYSYSIIEKVVSTPHEIVLYINVANGVLIPTIYFSSEENKLDFIQFIRSKCNSKVIYHELKS